MHIVENRFVIGPSNTLSAGMYVCTLHPGNFTGCGSEGVKNGPIKNGGNTTTIECCLLYPAGCIIDVTKKVWSNVWKKDQIRCVTRQRQCWQNAKLYYGIVSN